MKKSVINIIIVFFLTNPFHSILYGQYVVTLKDGSKYKLRINRCDTEWLFVSNIKAKNPPPQIEKVNVNPALRTNPDWDFDYKMSISALARVYDTKKLKDILPLLKHSKVKLVVKKPSLFPVVFALVFGYIAYDNWLTKKDIEAYDILIDLFESSGETKTAKKLKDKKNEKLLISRGSAALSGISLLAMFLQQGKEELMVEDYLD